MKITYEFINNELAEFGAQVESPVYCMIADFSGFLSSGKPTNWGVLAMDNMGETLYLTVHTLLESLVDSRGSYITIHQIAVEKLRITKALLMDSYTVDIKYRTDGKKYRHKIFISGKAGKEFTQQRDNMHNIINMLKKWASSL